MMGKSGKRSGQEKVEDHAIIPDAEPVLMQLMTLATVIATAFSFFAV
jgi:hypothetical protein